MKYLIVGLGNIGAEYSETRHNIGFKILDALPGASGILYQTAKLGDVANFRYKGRTLILLKPSTFMNLSGKAVNYWLQAEKIQLENLLVVTDDLNLQFGKQRLRPKGSDGGHNGLKSINDVLGTSDYVRLRIGIGSDFSKGQQVNYVLSPWSDEEYGHLDDRISIACETIKSFAAVGCAPTMTNFNNK